MESRNLKVFTGSAPSEGSAAAETADSRSAPMMPVAVSDLVPLLVDAFQSDRTWLKDFGREQMQVSQDLYDVLLAYQQLRRCDAA